MSGGVDSAVAAARAADAGHEVTGVHLALSMNPSSYRTGARGCCTLEDARDARRAADVIGIPFYVWDLAERFHDEVVQDFVAEYARGQHPESVPALQREDQVRRGAGPRGGPRLRRGVHRPPRPADCRRPRRRRAQAGPQRRRRQGPVVRAGRADQRAAQPRHVPARRDPPRTRCASEAAARGLAVADKPDSHDVCFIADGDTRKFLRGQLGAAPGQIVDEAGTASAATTALRLHHRPAQGAADRLPGAGRAGPGTCSTSSPRPAR